MKSLVCVVVALLAALVAVPTGWVATHVSSEDGYVGFTEPIAKDPAFRAVVSSYLASEVVARAGLPDTSREIATATITGAAQTVSESPGFAEAWRETQRRSHRIMFADQRDLPAELDASDRISVDLAPMAAFVLSTLPESSSLTTAAPQQLVVSVNGGPQSQTLEQLRSMPGYAKGASVVVVIACVLALVLTRRRGLALAGLGAGAVGVAIILRLGSDTVSDRILGQNTPPSAFAATLQQLLVDRVVDSFNSWLLVIAIVGGIATLVGLAAAAARAKG